MEVLTDEELKEAVREAFRVLWPKTTIRESFVSRFVESLRRHERQILIDRFTVEHKQSNQ